MSRPRERDLTKIRRWDLNTFKMSSQNLHSLQKIVNYNYDQNNSRAPYSRPIALSKYPHRIHKTNFVPQNTNFDIIKQTHPKGIIFIWPQRKHFYYEREYLAVVRFLSHLFYWTNIAGLFPSGTGFPMKKPPWKIEAPIPKPENRNYIIEPDWNSIYL